MSSIMRRRRGLKSAISILLSEGGGLQHPHPLSQEAIYATLPLTPRAAASFNPKSIQTQKITLYAGFDSDGRLLDRSPTGAGSGRAGDWWVTLFEGIMISERFRPI